MKQRTAIIPVMRRRSLFPERLFIFIPFLFLFAVPVEETLLGRSLALLFVVGKALFVCEVWVARRVQGGSRRGRRTRGFFSFFFFSLATTQGG
jgi:hypothetical protein